VATIPEDTSLADMTMFHVRGAHGATSLGTEAQHHAETALAFIIRVHSAEMTSILLGATTLFTLVMMLAGDVHLGAATPNLAGLAKLDLFAIDSLDVRFAFFQCLWCSLWLMLP